MGQSADATIAWGVVLSEDEYGDLSEATEKRLNELGDTDSGLRKLFGFTEEPPVRPGSILGMHGPELREHPDWAAHQAAMFAYHERAEAAIPVEFARFGSYDYGGQVLVVKRTRTKVNWGVGTVDPQSLIMSPYLAPRAKQELAALAKVLDAIGFTGNRTPQLLLFAMYG